jgi:hypothetical protein
MMDHKILLFEIIDDIGLVDSAGAIKGMMRRRISMMKRKEQTWADRLQREEKISAQEALLERLVTLFPGEPRY